MEKVTLIHIFRGRITNDVAEKRFPSIAIFCSSLVKCLAKKTVF